MEEREKAIRFRDPVLNAKGLRPIPINLNGKTLDWNMFSRPEKQQLKKRLKKHAPKIWEKIERSKKIRIYDEPLQENVYFCGQCNKTHVVHQLDEGTTPMFIECFNCKWPQARSLGYEIPDSYRNSAPDIIFRLPTKEEYDAAPEAVREYLENGGLYMEKIK